MEFNTHQLSEPLSKWVEAVFHFKDFEPDHSIERVVPTGHVFVLFELDGYTRHTYDNDTLEPNADFERSWISGIHDEYISISAHQKSEMLAVQFKPHGAYPFLHMPMDSIANQVIGGEEILEGELFDLRETLLEQKPPSDKIQLVEAWLLKRFREDKRPSEGIVDIVDALASAPTSKLNELQNTYNGTSKHLIDQFKRFVGVTPKVFQRILRFNEVFVKIQANGSIEWAEIANQCGYADQSHFIREFRRFSGFNPEEFIRSGVANDEGNFFPLDREG